MDMLSRFALNSIDTRRRDRCADDLHGLDETPRQYRQAWK
jgi:hypothetical protein